MEQAVLSNQLIRTCGSAELLYAAQVADRAEISRNTVELDDGAGVKHRVKFEECYEHIGQRRWDIRMCQQVNAHDVELERA